MSSEIENVTMTEIQPKKRREFNSKSPNKFYFRGFFTNYNRKCNNNNNTYNRSTTTSSTSSTN